MSDYYGRLDNGLTALHRNADGELKQSQGQNAQNGRRLSSIPVFRSYESDGVHSKESDKGKYPSRSPTRSPVLNGARRGQNRDAPMQLVREKSPASKDTNQRDKKSFHSPLGISELGNGYCRMFFSFPLLIGLTVTAWRVNRPSD